MENINIVGYIAGVCTTIAFLPQVIQIIKTKNTKDISLSMYIIFVSGVFLWLVYGLMTKDYPVVIANAVTFCLSAMVLGFKLKYK